MEQAGTTFGANAKVSPGPGNNGRVSRDLNVEATILSSAAPGRLHSARPVTSDFVGLVARRCTMVVNPRHSRNRRSGPVRERRLFCFSDDHRPGRSLLEPTNAGDIPRLADDGEHHAAAARRIDLAVNTHRPYLRLYTIRK
jgi:hypothetical protein